MHSNAKTSDAAPEASMDGGLLDLDIRSTFTGTKASESGCLFVRGNGQHAGVNLIDRIARKLRNLHHQVTRQGRHWLARTVYSLPFISAHDPRKRIVRCKDHCRVVDRFPRSPELVPEDWYLAVRGPEVVYRKRSVGFNKDQVAKFHHALLKYRQGEEHEIPEVFLACIHDANISTQDCIIMSSNRRVLSESALSDSGILQANGVLDRIIKPKPKHRFRTGFLLSHPWTRGYYHWILEALPRLSIWESFAQLDSIPLVVLNPLSRFQRESLEMAGVLPERVIEFDGSCCEIEQLFFPQILAPSGNPSPHAVAWLRDRFLKEPSNHKSSSGRRIYLTRRDASERRLINEEEVIRYLLEREFEIICSSELSLAEQVETFRNVEIVIAPHGAGATNMVFAPSNATLIEFFGDNYINGCYWALANICGQRHAFLTGPSEWLDYSIALDDLKALLEKLECFESGDNASKVSATPT